MSSILGMIRPPVGFGPGSQSDPETGDLAYLPMPSDMRIYQPHLPMATDRAAAAAARARLGELYAALAGWTEGREVRLPLDDLGGAARALIDETLGEGEVSVLVEQGGERLEIQEAALAGVWRVRALRADAALRESVLVSAFPAVAVARAFVPAVAAVASAPAAGLMNALPVLTELLDRSTAWRPGAAAHAVNFSLLPHTPDDMAFLEARLGRGATTILSRGYGNCRVSATATPHVWWVRYHNSVDTLILDTVEVADVPAVVCAAPEDIADSAERLAEILPALD